MAFTKTEAVVIKTINLGEADRIITFFSRDYGKIQGIAKGIRKIRTRYSGKLELFNRVEIIFFQKKEPLQQSGFSQKHPLLKITQVDLIEALPQLQFDFNRIIGASQIVELLTRVFEEYDASHKPVYTLVCQSLQALAALPDFRVILAAFELKLLAHLGYAPVLNACTGCGRPRTQTLDTASAERLLGFNFSSGGVLCPRCKSFYKGTFDVSAQALNVLQQLLETAILHVDTLIPAPDILQEITLLLRSCFHYHFGISLKTETFAQKLRSTKFLPKKGD